MWNHLQIVIILLLSLCAVGTATADSENLAQALEGLRSKSFSTKAAAVEQIAESGDPATRAVLSALLEGRIYKLKSDGSIVIVVKDSAGDLVMQEATTGTILGKTEKSSLKKVFINNKMRVALRVKLARLSLQASDPSARTNAVKALFGSLTSENIALLREAIADERHSDVLEALRIALALADLGAPEIERRIEAIDALADSMHS